MRNADYKIVPATPDIMRQFYGVASTCRAYAVIRGEEILGIGGIRFAGNFPIMFSDLKESERNNKRLIVRCTRKMQELVSEYDFPVFAEAEETIRGSDNALKHIGFSHLKDRIWHSSHL